jgi:hypothetical protein
MPIPSRFGESEILPRYIFLEPLYAHRRVLELGAVSATRGRSAAFLRERGARQVCAHDADLAAVSEARRAFSSDPDLNFISQGLEALPERAFEVVLVADATEVIASDLALALVERVATRSGHVVFGLRNPAGVSLSQIALDDLGPAPPTYGEVLERLGQVFSAVEAVTQSVLVGYQLAPAAPFSEVGLAVDGSLTDAVEAAYFLLVCSAKPARLFVDQTLVPLPGAPLAVAARARQELGERIRLSEGGTKGLSADLAKAREERRRLEDAISLSRREHDELARAAAADRERAARVELRAGEAAADRMVALEKGKELEALLAVRVKEVEGLRADVGELREEALRYAERFRRVETSLAAERAARSGTPTPEDAASLVALREERASLLRLLREAEDARDLARAEIDALNEENAAGRAGAEKQKAERDGMEIVLHEAEEERERLHGEIAARRAEAAALTAERDAMAVARREAEEARAQAVGDLSRMESERASRGEALAGWQRETEERIRELSAQRVDLSEAVVLARAELSAARRLAADRGITIAARIVELEAADRERVERLEELRQAREQLAAARAEIEARRAARAVEDGAAVLPVRS